MPTYHHEYRYYSRLMHVRRLILKRWEPVLENQLPYGFGKHPPPPPSLLFTRIRACPVAYCRGVFLDTGVRVPRAIVTAAIAARRHVVNNSLATTIAVEEIVPSVARGRLSSRDQCLIDLTLVITCNHFGIISLPRGVV